MVAMIFLLAVLAFILGYVFYGRFLARKLDLNDANPTPSHTDYDGIDRVPAHKAVLLGHHFSSIAGAGPIVGPIIAATAFGWGPTLLWVVLGAVFIGGVHDFSALVASIRHKARSVAEIARETMSPLAYKLLLSFIWLTLVYVLVVFTDLTSSTFVMDGGVATSSILFIALALGFGVSVYRLKIGVRWASILFVPLVFAAVWAGRLIPIQASASPPADLGRPGQDLGYLPDLLLFCRFDHAGLDPAPAPGLPFLVPALRFGAGGALRYPDGGIQRPIPGPDRMVSSAAGAAVSDPVHHRRLRSLFRLSRHRRLRNVIQAARSGARRQVDRLRRHADRGDGRGDRPGHGDDSVQGGTPRLSCSPGDLRQGDGKIPFHVRDSAADRLFVRAARPFHLHPDNAGYGDPARPLYFRGVFRAQG